MPVTIDPVAIQRIKSLESPGMPDVLKQIVDIFIESTPLEFAEMKRSDAEKKAKIAHKLKSSCSSLGIKEMTELCYQIETTATKMSSADLDHAILSLEQMFISAKSELKKLLTS